MRFIQFSPLMLSALLLISACSDSDGKMMHNNSEMDQPPKKVWTTQLVPASQGIKRHLTGTIQAADAVSISFEVTGVLAKMHVDLGQAFNKGDVLAELDKQVYLLAVQQNQSALAEADAALVDAKQTFARNNQLQQQGLVSQAALDTAVANFDIAKQRVNVASSGLAIAKENLSDTKLIAPYAGRVSARHVEPSQQVSPGVSVYNIQGNAKLEVNAAIPEGLIGKVALLDKVDVVVPSLSTSVSYAATLTEIGAQASIANAFPITITFDENYTGFYPGMSAEIILSVSSLFSNGDYFEVPFSSFTTDKTGPFLYFVAEKGSLASEEASVSDRSAGVAANSASQENAALEETSTRNKSIENINQSAGKESSVREKSNKAKQRKYSSTKQTIALKHYIEIIELKPNSAIIKFKQPPSSTNMSNARIVKTGLDFLRPNQAISVVETATQIYNQ